MADTTNGIAIVITDNVDASISTKITAIGTAARDADSFVKSLQQSLAALNSSGISSLRNDIAATQSSTAKLNDELRQNSTISKDAANSTQQLSNANKATAESAIRAAERDLALNKARRDLRSATKNLEQAQKELGASAAAGNATASATIASYKAEQAAAAQLVATLRNAAPAASNFGRQQQQVSSAAASTVPPVIAASAAIRGLEGNYGTSVRAAERFLITTLKLGPILQAAFPIFGALALLGIVDILVQHVDKLATAYKNMGEAAVKAEFDAIAAGEKTLKAKPEGFFSADRFARLLHGDSSTPQDIEVIQTQTKLRDLARERAEFAARIRRDEAGLQGEAQQRKHTADLAEEIQLVKKQKLAVDDLADSLKKQGEASKTIVTPAFVNPKTGVETPRKVEQISSLTDSQRNAVAEQFRTATSASKDLDSEIKILGFDMEASSRKEPLKAALDNTKAARAQMKQFKEELAQLKINAGGVVTPQQELALLQQQRKRALPGNIPEVDSQIGVKDQAIERQAETVKLVTDRLRDQKLSIGEYSDALREKNILDKINLQLQRDGIVLTSEQKKELGDLANYVAVNARYERELKTVYEQSIGPVKTYEASLRAINQLEADHAINTNQANIARNKAFRSYTESIFPLHAYVEGLKSEVELLGKYGSTLTVATEVQKVQNQLRADGRALTAAETQQLTQFLSQLEKQQTVQKLINDLYEKHQGTVEKIALAYAALNEARKKGIITAEQERVEAAKLKVQISELNIEMGKATAKDIFKATVGGYLKDFEGFSKGVTKLFQQTFTTLADGFADTLGRAIVYGEDLGAALKDVARQALSELISGLVKLGIQLLITQVIGQTVAATALTSTITEATAAASAWAPAAAFASLATLGANAAPAAAAISATTALTEALAFLHFNSGGLVPGYGSTDKVPSLLTPGEYVLNQKATSNIGLSTLEALNSGARYVQSSGTGLVNGYAPVVNIKVEHDGSTGVKVERMDDNTIRVIARQEAHSVVEKEAPRVIAADLQNPNSRTSKAVVGTKEVRHRRS